MRYLLHQFADVDRLLGDIRRPVIHARYGRHVVEQPGEALGVGVAQFDKLPVLPRRQVAMVEDGLQTHLYRRHGGLKLMVDIVGKLLLDTVLLLLLVHGPAMLAVTLLHSALQPRVKPYYVGRDTPQLIVGECLGIIHTLPPLGLLGKTVQARHGAPDAARGKVCEHTHGKGHRTHKPQKRAVGLKHLMQRQ